MAELKFEAPKPTDCGHDHGPDGHHHGHHHHHGPGHHHHHGASSNLKVALILNLVFSLIEFGGGYWTSSVAILSDAVHDFGDTLALASALILEMMARKKANAQFSYGYRRVSLLSALATCTFLCVASAGILVHAIPRLTNPVTPKLDGMLAFAFLGIAVNGYAAFRLKRGNTMSERVVSWHMIEDLLGWVAVLIGALVMMITDLPIIDPILSIGFTLFILYGVIRSLIATIRLFLQATPDNIDFPSLRGAIAKVDGVIATHDAHLWSLDGEQHVLTLHLVVRADMTMQDGEAVKTKVRALAAQRGKIHVTMELEPEGAPCAPCN